jgi:hypothetical protein
MFGNISVSAAYCAGALFIHMVCTNSNVLVLVSVHVAAMTVQKVYPSSWTEVSPGSFVYSHTLTNQDPTTLHLAVGNSHVGHLQLNNIGPAGIYSIPGSSSSSSSSNAATLALIDPQQEVRAGAEVSLQLNTTSVSFGGLSSAGAGLVLSVKLPNGTQTELGFMQAPSTFEGASGTTYIWVTQTPIRLKQVRSVEGCEVCRACQCALLICRVCHCLVDEVVRLCIHIRSQCVPPDDCVA